MGPPGLLTTWTEGSRLLNTSPEMKLRRRALDSPKDSELYWTLLARPGGSRVAVLFLTRLGGWMPRSRAKLFAEMSSAWLKREIDMRLASRKGGLEGLEGRRGLVAPVRRFAMAEPVLSVMPTLRHRTPRRSS